MPETFAINLDKPVKSATIVEDHPESIFPSSLNGAQAPFGGKAASAAQMDQLRLTQDLERQNAQIADLRRTLDKLVAELKRFYEQALAEHTEQIPKLAVEIAGKILMQKVQKGDYKIESILKEALKAAPTYKDIVVHLNPEDLAQCQALQQTDPDSAFADIKFISDSSVGRAECLLETPKGIIKSFINEHLARIEEALTKVG